MNCAVLEFELFWWYFELAHLCAVAVTLAFVSALSREYGRLCRLHVWQIIGKPLSHSPCPQSHISCTCTVVLHLSPGRSGNMVLFCFSYSLKVVLVNFHHGSIWNIVNNQILNRFLVKVILCFCKLFVCVKSQNVLRLNVFIHYLGPPIIPGQRYKKTSKNCLQVSHVVLCPSLPSPRWPQLWVKCTLLCPHRACSRHNSWNTRYS